MKIEVGKKYIDASSDIINIVRESEDLEWDFSDSEGCDYTNDGTYYFNGMKSKHDLICEVNDFILHRYENKLITKYKFLLEHYLLYGGNPDWINNKTNMK